MLKNILLILLILFNSTNALKNAVRGKKCAQNQVVNKLTVYEDGAIEAECGPLPCGSTGICSDDLSSCKAASDVFSGMKWARNGQSILLRCCSLQAGNKVYIGTDLVTLGSYYTGGIVPEKDMMGTTGIEYDFVANARTEQGGVRVWVYRIVCQSENRRVYHQQQQPSISHPSIPQQKMEDQMSNDEQPISEVQEENKLQKEETIENKEDLEEQSAQNPLQYRPRRNNQRNSFPINRFIIKLLYKISLKINNYSNIY
ncbi:hypothetical protein Mgra_00001531 [Meloidogyne graminicola]|uniref:Uncharacterized protein n=1 Tax=Meloidogyne graminicola TaxID=189291 RepID=A0A8T0A0R6_9BILA|nr:hypothetical protein Mgra_00001531 [Meloidogyne graminicola]